MVLEEIIFKVNYRYVGNPVDIDIVDIKNTIGNINKKYNYTQDIFENCKIELDDNNANITLLKPYSHFIIFL